VRIWPLTILVLLTLALHAEPAAREIPMEFREGLLWVEATIPGSKERLNFLVDSGASTSVLNLGTARRLALKVGPKVHVAGVQAASTGHWPVRFSAKVGGVELPGDYLALDLSKLSDACGRPVDGLVGADFFRDRVVQIDYTTQKVRLLDAAPHEASVREIRMEVRPGGFCVAIKVNGGESQWVRVDTGCASAFQWVTAKAHAQRRVNTLAVGLTGVSIPQTMTGLSIGEHHLDTVPTGLHRKAIFPGESGLVGNGLLATFGIVTIDAKAGRLFLGRSAALQ
jgi:predicted aspartyl protease